jgi:hypothetical protein
MKISRLVAALVDETKRSQMRLVCQNAVRKEAAKSLLRTSNTLHDSGSVQFHLEYSRPCKHLDYVSSYAIFSIKITNCLHFLEASNPRQPSFQFITNFLKCNSLLSSSRFLEPLLLHRPILAKNLVTWTTRWRQELIAASLSRTPAIVYAGPAASRLTAAILMYVEFVYRTAM